jgi:hypothetical protein
MSNLPALPTPEPAVTEPWQQLGYPSKKEWQRALDAEVYRLDNERSKERVRRQRWLYDQGLI